LNELVLALALNRNLLNLDGLAIELACYADGVPGDADFTLASCEAHGDARAATNKKNS
jgi:hypothetical protein